MDTADPSSNSKVIIQCTDPRNLYDSLEPRLSARSPLRNLHWKSPNRPLRSIPTLNVSLTREDQSAGAQSNVRRHQIPGLRETPYVKLYLLRCDDKETYKEKVRKEVRQWVKTQSPSNDGKSSGKNQEDHDAFEWMIVHVVLPNTPAASQTKSSKHISLEATDSTDSVNSKSKWTGKGSSTIFDKLRADFNSAKSPLTRVAQVRLLEPGDKTAPLSPAELEEQWQELVESLKACILRSFDARVAQYEIDIRERDSQRSLPGWNFCTFFVLKEGLAKGFESVGLLDDALAVYDELALGLDNLVKEQAQKDDHDDSGALLNFSKESKDLLRAALHSETRPDPATGWTPDLDDILTIDHDKLPFDAERKDYRSLILSNDVSALDLRIYLFTREMEILNRQGRVDQAKSPSSAKTAKASVNLNVVADITERAVQFISLAARSLRVELYNAWGGQEGLSEEELHTQRTVTGNIVSTWAWCAAMQILFQVLPALGFGFEYGTGSLALDAVELSLDADKRSAEDLHGDTRRTSLFPDARSSSRERSQERSKRISVMPNGTSSRQSTFLRPGSERLALWISKLVIMARQVTVHLEATKPWMAEIKHNALNTSRAEIWSAGVNGIGGQSSDNEGDHPGLGNKELLAGLKSRTLRSAATSRANFVDLYAFLSVLAYRVVVGAKSRTAVLQILTDLVELEYYHENHVVAARYLHNILGPLPRSSYQPSDGYLLRIYADCLKHLERPNEYARCLISCLHWSSQGQFSALSRPSPSTNQLFMDQLFDVSSSITPTIVPAATLFRITGVSRTVTHDEAKDGFSLSLGIRCVSGTSTPPIKDIRLRLLSKDGSEPRFLSLKSSTEVVIDAAGTFIIVETPVTTHGWYTPDEVELCIGNLRLLHHLKSDHESELTLPDETMSPRSAVVPVLVYPSHRSFAVRIYPFTVIHLAEIRRLLLQVRPGFNHVQQCKLRLKTATAGLRLNIHDSKRVGDEQPSRSLSTAREGDALMILLDDLDPGSTSEIEIPYTMEIASEPAVTIRIDASYETDQGTFSMYDTMTVKVILPVTVTVQDVFRQSCMYCRFTISPSTMVPLRVIDCKLEENRTYDAVVGGEFKEPLVVFPKQPAHWTVRLIPKMTEQVSANAKMTLVVDFQSLDGVILAILEDEFIKEIVQTRYAYAARLLTSHLLNRVRTTWTEQDVEVAGLAQEFEIWSMEDMDWPSVLCAFDSKAGAEIEDWLRGWHSRTPAIPFSASKAPQRKLKLFVDVPSPPILISASFDMALLRAARCTATVGQPLLAELVMGLSNSSEAEVEGSFELFAPSDSWLIGGRRKGDIRLSHQPVRTQVVLIPQHLGHLLLPAISVRCRKRAKRSDGGGDEWIEVMSEVYNSTHGRSVLVVPDLRSTTVEVFGVIPDEGRGRLVASESRGGPG